MEVLQRQAYGFRNFKLPTQGPSDVRPRVKR